MRYSNISDLYKQVQERKLTPNELEDREKIAKKLPMDDFKKRYGKDAMAVKMAVATNIAKGKSEEVVKEDGHQDIPSAIRQCKTITEDAMQIMSKLQGMSPEQPLPTWWTNKLAVASNSMNKMRDYLLVPSMKEQIELDEKAGDIPDLKDLVGELQNASKLHLGQSKRVQAHVDMMDRANAKGPEGAGGIQDLKKIVGELEKASQAHLRQSKSIDAHVKFMEKMENVQEEMTSQESLSNWKNDDAKGYAEKLIKNYGQPDEVTETMLKWNTLGSFGKGERETYIIDESIPHDFPKPHKDYVYTTMNIKVPSDMLDTLGYVTGSIIYDGLKEEVTARCGSLYANAATLGFVRDMVEGKVTTEKEAAKKEYADRITKDPLPSSYDNKMDESHKNIKGCMHIHEQTKGDYALVDKKDNRVVGVGRLRDMRKQRIKMGRAGYDVYPARGALTGDIFTTTTCPPVNEDTTMNKDLVDAVTKIMMGEVKTARQLVDPKKEVMVVKKNKVMVIDKKDQEKYMKMGYGLAEKVAKEDNTNDKSDDGEGLDKVQPKALKKKFKDRKDRDIDNDGDVDSTDKYLHKRRKTISKAIAKGESQDFRQDKDGDGKDDDQKPKKTKESYEIGKEYGDHTRKVTPGQSNDDFNKMVDVMQKKNNSMREALAKVWNTTEGKNPFVKTEGEHENGKKTMTGKKPTKVKVDPEVEENKK